MQQLRAEQNQLQQHLDQLTTGQYQLTTGSGQLDMTIAESGHQYRVHSSLSESSSTSLSSSTSYSSSEHGQFTWTLTASSLLSRRWRCIHSVVTNDALSFLVISLSAKICAPSSSLETSALDLNFNSMCSVVSVHGWLLFSANWPVLLLGHWTFLVMAAGTLLDQAFVL